MTIGDPYEILGVTRDADKTAIKKAYRNLAMKFHPDKNPGDKKAEEKFKEAAQAYEILSNDEKRSRFDRFGHQGLGGFQNQGFSDVNDIFSSFSDIFGDFFGSGMGGMGSRSSRSSHRSRRGADLRYILEISLKDVISGVEKEVSFDAEQTCKACDGSGAAKGSSPEVCQTCRGSGQVVRQQGFFSLATTCPTCHGQGQVIKNPCTSCRGQGRQEAKRKIRVTIPPGVDNGTRLRVSGEGEGGYKGGAAGDLYVETRVRMPSEFTREGLDLHSQIKISYLQALLGAKIEVSTVLGRSTLNIPRGTQPNDVLSIKGEGVPSLRSGRRGDLRCHIEVVFPRKISKKEEELLLQLAEIKGEKVESSSSGGFFNFSF